jgi:DNA-binding NtrC family response regulator
MTMKTSRVLIIDDDSILLGTMAATLRLRLPDAQIETADSALASLERIRANEYDAIICDAHQPRLEGIGFVRAVRKIHPECPVLLLLEKHNEDLIAQAMNAGAYDVLVKPVEEGTLLFAVHRAIEASRLRCQVKREEARLLATLGRVLKDLEVLYGGYGLQSNFDAFMEFVNAERQASRHKDDCRSIVQQREGNLSDRLKESG